MKTLKNYSLSEPEVCFWDNGLLCITIKDENQKNVAFLKGMTKVNQNSNLPYLDITVSYYTKHDSLSPKLCMNNEEGDTARLELETEIEEYRCNKTIQDAIGEGMDRLKKLWMERIIEDKNNCYCEDTKIREFVKKYKYDIHDFKVISIPIYADTMNDRQYRKIREKAFIPKSICDAARYARVSFQWNCVDFYAENEQILLSTVGVEYDDIAKPVALIL